VAGAVSKGDKLPLGRKPTILALNDAVDNIRAVEGLEPAKHLLISHFGKLNLHWKPSEAYIGSPEFQGGDVHTRLENLQQLQRATDLSLSASSGGGGSNSSSATSNSTGGVPVHFRLQFGDATRASTYLSTVSFVLKIHAANTPTVKIDVLQALALGGLERTPCAILHQIMHGTCWADAIDPKLYFITGFLASWPKVLGRTVRGGDKSDVKLQIDESH
jgi:hypothetical protein